MRYYYLIKAHHGLKIHLRVPIRVEQDDNISGGQVDAQTSGSSGKHEKEFLTARSVEFRDLSMSILVRRASVQTTVLNKSIQLCDEIHQFSSFHENISCGNYIVSPPERVVFENVEHASHLAENEDTRSLGLQFRQQLVENHHFAAVVDLVDKQSSLMSSNNHNVRSPTLADYSTTENNQSKRCRRR